MKDNENQPIREFDIPASLRRPKKEPSKMVQFRIPLSRWEELSELAQEFEQDVSTFLREAIDDWLRRARKARQTGSTGVKDPSI